MGPRYTVDEVLRYLRQMEGDGDAGRYDPAESARVVEALAELGAFEVMSVNGRWLAHAAPPSELAAVGVDPLGCLLALAGETEAMPPELRVAAKAVASRLLISGFVTLHGEGR